MHVCIVEDDSFGNLYPLSHLRPVFDLRCGILTLREKILSHISADSCSLAVRPVLLPLMRENNPAQTIGTDPAIGEDVLYVNGRVVMNRKAARRMMKERRDAVFMSGESVAALRLTGARVPGEPSPAALLKGEEIPDSLRRVDIDVRMVSFPWDIIYCAGSEIEHDIAAVGGSGAHQSGNVHRTAVLIGKKSIRIEKKSRIGPGVVLDASGGPVVIGRGVTIQANAVLYGPVSVGDGSLVKAGARICPGTVIGPVCKVAGEVEHSVFQGFANKAHDGYLGHSFISPWVNLGAGTTTSNLKNTYGTVRAMVNGNMRDSDRMFLGLTAGDHVKTGINTTLDTGTVIGVASNIFGAGLPPKYLPSFSWGSPGNFVPFRLDKALAIAATVMERRSVALTEAYAELMKEVFKATIHERAGDTTTV